MLKPVDYEEFRKLLLGLRARLAGDVRQLAASALTDNDRSTAQSSTLVEQGSDVYEQEFALRFLENDQEALSAIDLALEKIENATYGLCEGCLDDGKTPAKASIPKARLRVLPHARNCVNCERKREELAP